MVKLRVQPHSMASNGAVRWTGWYLVTRSERRPVGPLLEAWDYDQAIRLATSPEIDVDELMRSTGLDQTSEIEVVVTVDCSSTSRRFVSRLSVDRYLSGDDRFIGVDIPQGAVALELKMTCHLVLARDRPPAGNSATLAGSRLAESPVTRLVLEGEAGRFPTEALSFADLRWEPAAWSVRVDLNDMNEAFSGVVRLVLNTDHPVGAALASMEPKTYGALASVLRIDIVRSILVAAIGHVGLERLSTTGFDDESFGSVADQMANNYFGMGLAGVGEMRATEDARFERVLQARVGMDVMLP